MQKPAPIAPLSGPGSVLDKPFWGQLCRQGPPVLPLNGGVYRRGGPRILLTEPVFIEKRRVPLGLRRELERQGLGPVVVLQHLGGVSRVHRGVVGGHYGCFS